MSEPIFEDPVVDEIHAIRASMLDECGGDIEELMRRVSEHQRQSGHRIITEPLRKPTRTTDAAEPK